jgi:hypothetical protein
MLCTSPQRNKLKEFTQSIEAKIFFVQLCVLCGEKYFKKINLKNTSAKTLHSPSSAVKNINLFHNFVT